LEKGVEDRQELRKKGRGKKNGGDVKNQPGTEIGEIEGGPNGKGKKNKKKERLDVTAKSAQPTTERWNRVDSSKEK